MRHRKSALADLRVNKSNLGQAQDWWMGPPSSFETRPTGAPQDERGCRSIHLAPDAERFLHRTVGDREQHGLLGGMVLIAFPRRHHEHVVDAPLVVLAIDRGAALALGALAPARLARCTGLEA